MRRLRLSTQLVGAMGLLLGVSATLVGGTVLLTRQMTEAHRAIVEGAVPAVRLELELLETVSALRRIEARHLVLRDQAFRTLFLDRAQAALGDVDRLESLLDGQAKARAREIRALLAIYRDRMERGGLSRVGEDSSAARLEIVLESLYQGSAAELRRRQQAAESLASSTRRAAFAALGAALAVAAGVTSFAVFRIARPLRRLQAATRSVAARAFSEPIPVDGPGEIADLTAAFNTMASQLGELDRMKDEFFTAVSHDLRTPLAAIRWSADLLHSGRVGALTAKQARLMEGIQASAQRLMTMVGQIVDLGRLRAGRIQLDRRPTAIARVVADAVEEVRPLLEQSKLRIEVDAPADLPPVLADESRVNQVLINLLGNAVRFTPPGGRIGVQVAAREEEIVVSVSDTGVGIPADLLPRVFDLYEQAHQGRGGSGIGLTVVRGLVERHGGRVWVDSEEGRGSCFSFTLPLSGAAPVGERAS
ncbi:MAG TPA: HAMP domain-containing sensor histidine kinase [Methylomirabilota bacterium]|jgi:signal transduction histidine kinase|nr:HAMP domain-containing sensor histidine kinase [Methylomirabilota bacterium]